MISNSSRTDIDQTGVTVEVSYILSNNAAFKVSTKYTPVIAAGLTHEQLREKAKGDLAATIASTASGKSPNGQ